MKKLIIFYLFMLTTVSLGHPLVSVNMSATKGSPGDAIWIKLNTSKALSSGYIKLNNKRFKLFNKNNSNDIFLSCLGISRYAKAKKTRIEFSLKFKDGSQYETSLPFTILKSNFKKEHITLSPKKHKLKKDKPSRNNENRLIGQKFRTISNKQKFKGNFIWPVKGRFTSEFGTQRMYNNRPGWMHSGIDISANTGVPIKATQSGTIILAKKLKVHGNTVMIDHGMGIISIYNHLDQIHVNLNDNVKKGFKIGTVGSTGIATGSHLHFGISIQSIRVNPRTWLEHSASLSI